MWVRTVADPKLVQAGRAHAPAHSVAGLNPEVVAPEWELALPDQADGME